MFLPIGRIGVFSFVIISVKIHEYYLPWSKLIHIGYPCNRTISLKKVRVSKQTLLYLLQGGPQLEQRFESYYNYCNLFNYILSE